MRVENWNPNVMDQSFEGVAIERLEEAAEVVKSYAKQSLASKLGTGQTYGISRPIYKSGPYAGQPWTKRDPGELMRSIRVTRLRTKSGKAFSRKRNVRIYAGNYLAYYARIFEYSKPFFRPAVANAMADVKSIIGAK